MFEPLVL